MVSFFYEEAAGIVERRALLAPLFPEPKRRKDGRGRLWAAKRAIAPFYTWA
jgi:hypothetical protein